VLKQRERTISLNGGWFLHLSEEAKLCRLRDPFMVRATISHDLNPPGTTEQYGAVARVAGQIVSGNDYSLHLGADAEFLIKPPHNLVANTQTLTLSDRSLAFASVKRLLLLTGGADLEQQMKHESVSIVQMSRSRDGLAGVKAFKDKVEPSFVGS
jgi:hypothetical protein